MRVSLLTSKGQCCGKLDKEKRTSQFVKKLVNAQVIQVDKWTRTLFSSQRHVSQGTAPQRRQERAWPTSPCPLDHLGPSWTRSSGEKLRQKTGETSKHCEQKQERKKN